MPPVAPPFLARRAYRRRRLQDFARALPVLGLVLFLLPLAGGSVRTTGGTGIWLFACWGGLVLTSALIAPYLVRDASPEGGEGAGR